MTRHKAPEDRRREILDAAARVIEEVGYRQLTMERIIAHTTLSKGGVYRFYGNKREVALALFRQVLGHWTEFDEREVLGWQLPLRDTLLRLLVKNGNASDESERARRIWLQLLPACLDDAEFLEVQRHQLETGQERMRELIRMLLDRDGLAADDHLEQVLQRAIRVGTLFMEGMLVSSLSQDDRHEDVEQFLHEFLDSMLATALMSPGAASARALPS